jgi:hypothetical protein
MVKNGKEWENTSFSSVAATFEKAITYVFAEIPIRNAEARSSTPLCSTKNTTAPQSLHLQPVKADFFNWPIRGQREPLWPGLRGAERHTLVASFVGDVSATMRRSEAARRALKQDRSDTHTTIQR